MNIWTNLLLVYIILLIVTYIKLAISKKDRDAHKKTRIRLEELRNIGNKTKDEQREFLDLKYPRTPPFKWSTKSVLKIIGQILFMIALFIPARFVWDRFIGIEFALWQVLLMMVVIPILLNMVLKKFNLHRDDLLVFFR